MNHILFLDVEFQVPNRNSIKSFVYENKGYLFIQLKNIYFVLYILTAVLTIPYSYVCGNNINKGDDDDDDNDDDDGDDDDDNDDDDDDDDDDDLDDRFKGCYPVSFPPGNIIKYYNFNNILCIYGCV